MVKSNPSAGGLISSNWPQNRQRETNWHIQPRIFIARWGPQTR